MIHLYSSNFEILQVKKKWSKNIKFKYKNTFQKKEVGLPKYRYM